MPHQTSEISAFVGGYPTTPRFGGFFYGEKPMDRNFDAALVEVLKHEGGYVNHPNDPGGPTNKGITLATFKRHLKRSGTVADLKNLTTAQAGIVYRKQYWDKVRGDDLPSGIDYAVFDFAVNSGPARAAKYLQAVLDVPVDGAIGPVTLAAARKANAATVIERLCADRLAFMKRLKIWPTFKNGWIARVSAVEIDATKMAQNAPSARPKPAPAPQRPETPQARPTGRKINPWAPIAAIIAGMAAAAYAYLKNIGVLP